MTRTTPDGSVHLPTCSPYCAKQHCLCGRDAAHGERLCSRCLQAAARDGLDLRVIPSLKVQGSVTEPATPGAPSTSEVDHYIDCPVEMGRLRCTCASMTVIPGAYTPGVDDCPVCEYRHPDKGCPWGVAEYDNGRFARSIATIVRRLSNGNPIFSPLMTDRATCCGMPVDLQDRITWEPCRIGGDSSNGYEPIHLDLAYCTRAPQV
jgi:hypothetical protein